MYESIDYNGYFKVKGNWDKRPQKLQARVGQLTLSDLAFEVGKEDDLLTWIGIRLNKRRQQVINIFRHL